MTELDKALEKYLQDEAEQATYYDLILKTDFYIPLNSEDTDTPLEQQQSVTPLILKSDDKHYMMLFDSEEKLTSWAQKPTDYVVLAGYKVAELTIPKLHWAVNIGSGFAKEFLPEEIDWLKTAATSE